MKETGGRVVLLLLFVMVPAGLRPVRSLSRLATTAARIGRGTVSAGSLSTQSSAYGLYPDPFATADASWDVVFPTAELLAWQIGWSYGADYSVTLDMAGQYAPLQQWVSENLTGAVWNQTVAAGEYTFAAYTQDYGEGDASLSANLIATTPAGDPDPPDPAPEPGTWLLAGGVFASLGLFAAGRSLTVKMR